jgi:aminoglycoside phosphotransferase (APT) family kinase protein
MTGGLSEGAQRIEVDDALVTSLIRAQFRQMSELEVGRRYVFEDHITVRIGDEYYLNLPTIAGLDASLEASFRWLPRISAKWTFPASVPLFAGAPTADYPFQWEIARWLPGSNAGIFPLVAESAPDLGDALRQVHAAAPPSAPASAESGLTLAHHRAAWHEATADLREAVGPRGERIDPAQLSERWERAVDTVVDTTPRWTHGNLDPRYVVTDQGRFAGICTWWTIGAGDPAADIAAALLLIPREAEAAFYDAYGDVSKATRERIAGYWLLRAVRYATSSNPFLWRLGWARLDELILMGDLK